MKQDKLFKSNIEVKVGTVFKSTIRQGYMIYFKIYNKRKVLSLRADVMAKKRWDSGEKQYIYWYKCMRFWELKRLKHYIKTEIISGKHEIINN